MSISIEQAEKHKNDIAVVCCRTEEGTVIAPENLEDPAILPDLEDSGLLNVPGDVLKIGEVIGSTLTKTIDSLTALTPDVVNEVQAMEAEEDEEVEAEELDQVDEVKPVEITQAPIKAVPGQPIKIVIEEGIGIDIEIQI